MALKRLGVNIFYDTEVLSWGDNWKKIFLMVLHRQNLLL